MAMRPLPSQTEIIAALDYDPQTGVFIWRARPNRSVQWNGRYAGTRAGKPDPRDGRLTICLLNQVTGKKKLWRAARLAWVYVYGVDPINEVDHADGNAANDAIWNLREATSSQQKQNKRGWSRRGMPKGTVITGSGKFGAQITLKGEHFWLGSHDTIEQARLAYAAAATRLFGEFARTQ